MKQVFYRIIVIFALFVPLTSISQAATETYKLDPNHTYVLWHVPHFGYSTQVGKFVMIEGTLTVDEAKPENSKINVIIHTDKMATGIPKLEEHMASDEFLNVKKYPTATFVSDKVVVTGKDTGKVYGTLTLLGVSKPVTLDVKFLKQGIH